MEPVTALPPAGVRAVKQQIAAARRGDDAQAQVTAFASVWGADAHKDAMG